METTDLISTQLIREVGVHRCPGEWTVRYISLPGYRFFTEEMMSQVHPIISEVEIG